MTDSFEFVISGREASVRLDHFLVQRIPGESRSRISSSVQASLVYVDGKARKNSYRLKAGERVTGSLIAQPEIDITPEQIDFEILFEDEYLIALSKPPGLVVHPGCGHYSGTLVNGLVHYCASISDVGDPCRPGLVHRLDKDTSGVLLVAKQEQVHRRLVDAFQSQSVEKYYVALLSGICKEKEGRIAANIGRDPIHRQKMAVRQTGGKHAATNWMVLREFGSDLSLVRLKIETGRTHQIRVHMAYLGAPVAGDSLYGRKREGRHFARQMLHASKVFFDHPVTEQKMEINAPLWPDFADVLRELQKSGDQKSNDIYDYRHNGINLLW